MELHPMLERDTPPNAGLWYVLSCLGETPTMRVGHTCTYIKPQDPSSTNGKLYVIGGANPSGSFGDVYVLDLDTLQWDTVDTPGFKPRYEHVAFVPENSPEKIYIFGGADQTGNLNDVQFLDTVSNTWTTPEVEGTPPVPRTHHTSAAVGDKFVVYSGGHSGADPVGDRKVHVFDVSTATWSQPSLKGDPPKPRHGHVMLSLGNKVYVHGGMATTTFYDDLHVLDLEKESWSSIKKKKSSPSARAAHGGVVHGSDLYIFGGMNKDGALDDLHKLDTGSMTWSVVKVEGPPPASRLDFGMCVIEVKRALAPSQENAPDIKHIAAQTTSLLEEQIDSVSSSTSTTTTTLTTETSTETDASKLTESLQACNMDATTHDKVSPRDVSTNNSTTEDSSAVTSATAADSSTVTSATAEASSTAPSATAVVKTFTLCLINGGMDTQGEIFDDTLVISLD